MFILSTTYNWENMANIVRLHEIAFSFKDSPIVYFCRLRYDKSHVKATFLSNKRVTCLRDLQIFILKKDSLHTKIQASINPVVGKINLSRAIIP